MLYDSPNTHTHRERRNERKNSVQQQETMKGRDLINTYLPEELIMEIMKRVESKSSRDACSLVCKRWLSLDRLCRSTLRVGASGNPDLYLSLLSSRFHHVSSVHVDERLSLTPNNPHPLSYRNSGRKKGVDWSRLSSRKRDSTSENDGSDDGKCETYYLSDTGLSTIAEGFPKLEKLSLIWCSNITSAGLVSLACKCVFLTSIDLQGCYVGDVGLVAVGLCCKQLQQLNLRFCEGCTDIGLVELVQGCGKSLKSLGVAACARITDKSMEAVGANCRSLEYLSLDLEYVHDSGIIAVAQGCSHLKALKLQCYDLTEEALVVVGAHCSSLELFTLNNFQHLADKGTRAIGKGCKKLKSLAFSDCSFLSDIGLEAIATGCKELTRLEVNGCHNIGTKGLEIIGKSCLHLTDLALLYCQRIGNSALVEVGRGCKFLNALHLVDCPGISDEALCSIAKGCQNLTKLHLRRCYEIGNKGIIAVGKHCKSLTDLSIRFCDRVGNEALIAIGEGCSLYNLNISGCHEIGDPGITAIARGCPDLTYLDVSVLQNLGDAALIEVGEGCPSLKEAVLSHCRQITDVGLRHLVSNCPALESCHIVYCPGITAAGVATIVSSCPNIKKVLVEKWKVSERTKRRAGSVITYLCVDL